MTTDKYPTIVFRVWENGGNYKEMDEFLGPQPECEVCGGTGEYEKDGPKGCPPCNSRLFFFIDYRGIRVGADDMDWITKEPDGLHLHTGGDQ